MPPSPALRTSPARGKLERHKRGRSVESALHDRNRDKDDDLALFQDMQTKERDSFLHHSGDDSDESITLKLRGFSEYRLSISAPANKESSDLLTNDADKNDYDWLLTPPDTPLFPSLDDETPPVNLSHRGRLRTQPIHISRASRTETSSRAGRSSASPRRSSPSSGSSSINVYSKRRASPGPSASVSPTLRPITPSVRPSTPTSKPSTPPIRSTTPIMRRSSTGSVSSVGRGGSSSGKANRGSSSSPKLQAWHSDNPEFAAEPPPNLRTSISDRPISRTRGSSPASRRGLSPASRPGSSPASKRGSSPASKRGSSPASKRGSSPASSHGVETGIVSRRQSVSPTVSRSASSSNSHDRDRLSSQSKGSAISSCEDEMDSVQSTFSGNNRTSTIGMVGRQATRRQEPYPHSRIQPLSKKPMRSTPVNVSTGSAPKKSFESALRQMDVRRHSQSMFRPLLSSAPATSFYASKINMQRRTCSINSSVTTSSNASSEQGASVAPDTECSDHDQDEVGSEGGKSLFPHVQQDVLIVDKMEVKIEDEKTHSIGVGRQQDVDHEHDGTGSISCSTDIIPLGAHDECSFSEMKLKELDNGKNGKVVVDINGESVDSAMDDGMSYYCHNDVICYANPSDHMVDMVDVRVTDSVSKRKECALHDNDGSADGHFVDIEEDVPLRNPIHDKDDNGTRRHLQTALPHDLETDSMQKLNWTSSQEIYMPKSAVKQDDEIGLFPLNRSGDLESRHKQGNNGTETVAEIGTIIAINKLTEVKQQDNPSKLKGDEGTTQHEIKDDPRITGILSQEMLGRVSLEVKGELSHGSTASMNHLNRASSCKWPVVHTKAVNAAGLPEEGSRLRRSLNDLKSIRNEENASTSQSSDACSTKQTEIRVSRQTSNRKLDIGNFAISSNMKVPSAMSTSGIGIQNDAFQNLVDGVHATVEAESPFVDVFEIMNNLQSSSLEHTAGLAAEEAASRHQTGTSESLIGKNHIESVSTMQDNSLVAEMDVTRKGTVASEIMSEEPCCASDVVSNLETRDLQYSCNENYDLSEDRSSCSERTGENGIIENKQAVLQIPEKDRESAGNKCDLLPVSNDCCMLSSLDSNDENTTQESSLNGLNESDKSCQTEATASLVDQNTLEMPTEPSAPSTSEETGQSQDINSKNPEPESCEAEPVNGSQEEQTIKADVPKGLSRSLTLEEATDTILFCSSIVHSLAYKAATIAMEKENLSSIEVSRPMVTIVGKPEPDLRDSCAGAAGRRKPKFQKTKSRQTAAHLQAPSNNIETNLKNQEPVMHVVTIPESANTGKPSNINSKCNCTIM